LLYEFYKDMPVELFEQSYNDDGSYEYHYKNEVQDIFDSNWLKFQL